MDLQTLNATVVYRRDLNDRLAVVRVAPGSGDWTGFLPGQAATLGLPDPRDPARFLRRTYSIASPPGAEELEFYVQLVKPTDPATRLWHLEEGDGLWLAPQPAGRFTLEGLPNDADFVLVGTGTGLAPYLSMLRHFRGTNRWSSCAVVHGARDASELGYRDELSHWAAEDEDIRYVPTLTREAPDSDWAGPRGRVTALLVAGRLERELGRPLDPARTQVFLCGNPAMVDEMEALLAARGFTPRNVGRADAPPGNLHFERWW